MIADLSSGEEAYRWTMADYDGMTDGEIIEWYDELVKRLNAKNEALEKALKSKTG